MTKEEERFNSIITELTEEFAVTKEDEFNYIIKTGNLHLFLTFNPEDLNIKVKSGGREFKPFISHYPFNIITELVNISWEPITYIAKFTVAGFTENEFISRVNTDLSRWKTGGHNINTLIIEDDEITLEIRNKVDIYTHFGWGLTHISEATFPFKPSIEQLDALYESWYNKLIKVWVKWCNQGGNNPIYFGNVSYSRRFYIKEEDD